MHTITYVSSAVSLLSHQDLLALLKKSREKNDEFNITGLLLYKEGNFIQTIEGPEAPVRQLYRNICNDRSHRNVITLLDEEIAERVFPQWSMGFMDIEHNMAQGCSDFLRPEADLTDFWSHPHEAKILLHNFREGIR